MLDERKEVNEAIAAGQRALTSLQAAEAQLGSARGWGIFDMLGGGLITDLVKHSKIHNAQYYLETAKADLKVFERELRDIPNEYHLEVAVGGFLSFADFFFDGLVADYLVQSKINEFRRNVQEAIQKVEAVLTELRNRI